MSIKALLLNFFIVLLLPIGGLNAQLLEKDAFEYIGVDTFVLSNKVEINSYQERQVNDYLSKVYGDFWDYDVKGVFNVAYKNLKFIKLNLFLKEDKIREFVKRQRERMGMGKPKESSNKNLMIALDLEQNIFELPFKFDAKNKGLRFDFSNCPSEASLASFDINKDGKNELVVIKGYESAFNNYGATYNHYKIYAFNDSLLFESWLSNTDYQSLTDEIVDKPKITGLNNGKESDISVYYDENNQLLKIDGLGLYRNSSLFFFDHVENGQNKISKQLIIIWSRTYRPFIKSEKQVFEFDDEVYRVYEGDVLLNQSFVEKVLKKEDIKDFIEQYNLSFDDGLTMKRLCN